MWLIIRKNNAKEAESSHFSAQTTETIRTSVVLCFELWGYRNPHLVEYETSLALTLHTAIRHKRPVSYRILADIARRYDLSLIESIETGRSKGFGFVEMSSDAEAKEAINRFNGQELDGRKIKVDEARPKREKNDRGGGGRHRGGRRRY